MKAGALKLRDRSTNGGFASTPRLRTPPPVDKSVQTNVRSTICEVAPLPPCAGTAAAMSAAVAAPRQSARFIGIYPHPADVQSFVWPWESSRSSASGRRDRSVVIANAASTTFLGAPK
jgi:hypothetical protein